MGEIDPAFIQDPEYRPELKPIEPDEIPVISLSVSSPSDIERILSEIGDACQKWGFFQVINHGVSLELRQKVEKLAKEFFNQPLEEKLKVKRNEVYPVGYYDGEHTKNVRDWKEVFDFLLKDSTMLPVSFDPDDKELRTLTNQWPEQYPPEFRLLIFLLVIFLINLRSNISTAVCVVFLIIFTAMFMLGIFLR
uniref:Oxidoreductase family protein n=1 Tax=Rhizophora mucronata TaxID=61149 RepID=A0A2P2JZV8_RHIMU